MKKKIAIILAFNPSNAGMYSVDRSAYWTFGNSADYFSAQWISGRRNRIKSTFYANVYLKRLWSSSQLTKYSKIIYWGDFLHNPAYGLNEFTKQDLYLGLSNTKEEALSRWRDCFFLDDINREDTKPRIFAVGGNFLFDDESPAKAFHKSKQTYKSALSNFKHIFPRDPESYSNLEKLKLRNVSIGLDCAFLLRGKDSQHLPYENNFSYFFSRSNIPDSIRAQIIRQTEIETRAKKAPLNNWFDFEAKTFFGIPFLPLRLRNFKAMRSQIRASKFVLTDTYHVAINALSLGTPVVCILRQEAEQVSSIGDRKKELLFESLGALNYCYFYSDSKVDQTASEIATLSSRILRDTTSLNNLIKSVQSKTDQFESNVLAVLRQS